MRHITMLTYKVIETSDVTDSGLERILNEWVPQGWHFEGFHFAMREASRRPAMAFVMFVRHEGDGRDRQSVLAHKKPRLKRV